MKLAILQKREAGGWTAVFAVIAVIALGQSLQVASGELHPTALVFLGIAVVALILGVATSGLPDPGPWAVRGVLTIGGTAICVQLYQLTTEPPGWYLQGVPIGDYLALLTVFAALTAPVVLQLPSFKRVCIVGWFAAFAGLGVWLIGGTPAPENDIYSWTHHALNALSHGENPYAVWMPNIFGEGVTFPTGENMYGRSMSADNKWVQTGYPYPPMSLMLSGTGYLFGDMRWANLACILGGAVALFGSRGRFAVLGVVLLLTTPRIFLMLQQAWTDAYCFGLLALTITLSARSSRLTPWAFGFAIASKQYMVFLVPLGLLLIPTPWDRKKVLLFIGQALLAGTLATLPWLLWNPQALLGSISAQNLPFRHTSLSFLAAIAVNGVPSYANTLPFMLLIPAYVLVLLCSARGAAGFALSTALILGVFFSFAKSAYCNQHFLVLGCAAAALATVRFDRPASPVPESVSPPSKP